MNIQIKIIILLFLLSLGSCRNKEEEVNKSVAYLNKFTSQLLAKVRAQATLKEGIKSAQKYLDSQKSTMKQHIQLTKNTNRAEVSDKTMKAWQSAVVINIKRMEDLRITYVGKALRNRQLSKTLNKLVKDYRDLLQK